MTTIKAKHTVSIAGELTLSERELRALDALAGYDDDAFVKVFYAHLGSHYLKPHEAGLRELFRTVRQHVPAMLRDVDRARAVLAGHDVEEEDR